MHLAVGQRFTQGYIWYVGLKIGGDGMRQHPDCRFGGTVMVEDPAVLPEGGRPFHPAGWRWLTSNDNQRPQQLCRPAASGHQGRQVRWCDLHAVDGMANEILPACFSIQRAIATDDMKRTSEQERRVNH